MFCFQLLVTSVPQSETVRVRVRGKFQGWGEGEKSRYPG